MDYSKFPATPARDVSMAKYCRIVPYIIGACESMYADLASVIGDESKVADCLTAYSEYSDARDVAMYRAGYELGYNNALADFDPALPKEFYGWGRPLFLSLEKVDMTEYNESISAKYGSFLSSFDYLIPYLIGESDVIFNFFELCEDLDSIWELTMFRAGVDVGGSKVYKDRSFIADLSSISLSTSRDIRPAEDL